MATVQQVINRSLRLIGVLATGQTPEADETADALTALNAMLDGWMNDKLMTYSLQNITVPLVAGTASYTIGTSGATVTATSPVRIESAYTRKSNIDYLIELIDSNKYNGIASKTSASDIPEYLYFNGTNPNSTITLYPVPNEVNNLYLTVWTPYAAFAAATDTFTMPNGYEDAVAYNLAIRLWPEYPAVQLSPVVVELAKTTLASIKRINQQPVIQTTQLAKMFGKNRGYNIISGA